MALNQDNEKTESLTIFDFSKGFVKEAAPLKILITDDDPPSRMLLSASLKQWGYEVVEACDGEEAWGILQKPNPPRLLILDWIMPKLDGINLCMKIRKELYDSSSFYIILLSQVSGNSNIRLAIDGGANEFLSKPFDYQELRSRIFSAARLINYANDLSEQNKKLKVNLAPLQELARLVFEMSKQIDEIVDSSSQLEPSQLAKVQELESSLKKAVDLIKTCQLD